MARIETSLFKIFDGVVIWIFFSPLIDSDRWAGRLDQPLLRCAASWQDTDVALPVEPAGRGEDLLVQLDLPVVAVQTPFIEAVREVQVPRFRFAVPDAPLMVDVEPAANVPTKRAIHLVLLAGRYYVLLRRLFFRIGAALPGLAANHAPDGRAARVDDFDLPDPESQFEQPVECAI